MKGQNTRIPLKQLRYKLEKANKEIRLLQYRNQILKGKIRENESMQGHVV